jgi:hypothetical protein
MNYEGLMSQLEEVTTPRIDHANGIVEGVPASNGATNGNGAKHGRNDNGAKASI